MLYKLKHYIYYVKHMQYLFTVVKYCKLTCCLQYCITFVDSCAMQFIKSKVPICFGYLAGCSFK